MAFFGVTCERLTHIWDHPNADALELGKLEGMSFQFVLKKGKFKLGDQVVYFPIDSLLPDSLAEACGVLKRLAGAKKNRLKTIRLRGELSQGLVVSMSTIDQFLCSRGIEWAWRHEWSTPSQGLNSLEEPIETNIFTQMLNVIKHEAPITTHAHQNARLSSLPSHLSKYDIEDASRYAGLLMSYFDDGFVATLKLEGSNFCVGYNPNLPEDKQLYVCSRNHLLMVNNDVPADRKHYFLKYTEGHQLHTRIRTWADQCYPGQDVSLYGEMLGPNVQKNLYNLKDYQVIFFDIKVGGQWLDYVDFKHVCVNELNLHIAPEVIGIDDPRGQSLSTLTQEVSITKLSHVLTPLQTITTSSQAPLNLTISNKVGCHEGIVIKPYREQHHPSFGRVILKKRCPEYLERSGL